MWLEMHNEEAFRQLKDVDSVDGGNSSKWVLSSWNSDLMTPKVSTSPKSTSLRGSQPHQATVKDMGLRFP